MANTDLPAAKPLDGTTTVDDKMRFEPERLSYDSAVLVAGKVADRSAEFTFEKAVVIAGTDLLVDLSNLRACLVIVDDLAQAYEGLTSHAERTTNRFSAMLPAKLALESVSVAADPAAAAVTATANLALGLVSLFRQDVTYNGRSTQVDDLAFQISLASEIKRNGAEQVFVPGLLVLSSRPGSTQIERELARVQQARAAVWNLIGPLVSGLVLLERQLAEAVSNKDQQNVDNLTAQLTNYRREMEPLTAPLDRADRRLSDLMTQWNSVDATTGMTTLGRLLRAEAVSARAQVYVHAQVVSSGGYYKTWRNLFRTLFSGDGLSFSGGVVVRWAVLSAEGDIQRGGVLSMSRKARHEDDNYEPPRASRNQERQTEPSRTIKDIPSPD